MSARRDSVAPYSGLRARARNGERGCGNRTEPEPVAVAIRPPLPAHAEGLAKHDRADFAQEFLRRNLGYRAAWDRVRGAGQGHAADGMSCAEAQRWGLVRMFDPRRMVRSAPALWRGDCASQIVPLTPAPPGLPGAARLPEAVATAENLAGEVRDLVLEAGGVRHRLRVLGAGSRAPVAILLPPLADPLRFAACDAARRMLAGLSVAEPASALRPSALQRQRLALLLRVLDASLAGASNREIGSAIVYPWLAGTDAVAWKAMSERRRVQRLVAEARDLAASGYRGLLRG